MKTSPRMANASIVAPAKLEMRLVLGVSMFVPLVWLAMLGPAAARLPF